MTDVHRWEEIYPNDSSMLAKWGIIIEMNRLDRIVETTPHSTPL